MEWQVVVFDLSEGRIHVEVETYVVLDIQFGLSRDSIVFES